MQIKRANGYARELSRANVTVDAKRGQYNVESKRANG